MKQLLVIALVAIMFTLCSIASAQWTPTGAPTCASSNNVPSPDGVTAVSQDANGDTTYVLQGPQGNTGTTGANGQNGQNGTNGKNGHNGHRGGRGPRGQKGDQGVPGRDGRDGRDGYNIVTVPASTTTNSGAAGEGGSGMWIAIIFGALVVGGIVITMIIMSSDTKVQLANAATAQGQQTLGMTALTNQSAFVPTPGADVSILAVALPHGGNIMRARSTPLPQQQQQAAPAANVQMTDAAWAAMMGALTAPTPVQIHIGQ